MAEQLVASLQTSIVETDEQPFRPGEQRLDFVLIPTGASAPFTPPSPTADVFDPFAQRAPAPLLAQKRRLFVDIESTGLMPFDSQIMTIGVFDPSTMTEPQSFFSFDERELVESFLAFFRSGAYEVFVAYNAPFDYRFLFAKAMKYRLDASALFAADVEDLQDRMQKVKPGRVFGLNRPGTLGEWQEYFFGVTRTLDVATRLKLWEARDVEPILADNRVDVQMVYLLWLLFFTAAGESSA